MKKEKVKHYSKFNINAKHGCPYQWWERGPNGDPSYTKSKKSVTCKWCKEHINEN